MLDLRALMHGFPPGHGPLGLLSGDEFTPAARAFDDALLTGLKDPRIAVIVCADHRSAKQTIRAATDHFADATVVEADMHGDELPDADVYYIAGGSPKDLLDDLSGDPRWPELLDAWRVGKTLAGASAGAMALCTNTLTPEEGASLPTRWAKGLGPIETVALAVHASTRPREWLHDVAERAPVPLIAIDDATGLVLRENAEPEIAGPGSITSV